MAQTKVVDLINPEVLADAMAGELEKAIRFAPYARIDSTLEGVPGDTITRPKYGYVGPAEDLTEGVPMDPTKMSMTTTTVTIKETGKAIEVTEKAIITNLNGTMSEAQNQLNLSLADKVEMDYVTALDTALQTSAATFTPEGILDAVDVFNDEDEEDYVLFINPKDYSKLVKSLFSVGGKVAEQAIAKAQVAELVGVNSIERTRRVAEGTAYIQKVGAVEIIYKRRPQVNGDRDILARTYVLAANQYYGINLYNDKGVVKLTGA